MALEPACYHPGLDASLDDTLTFMKDRESPSAPVMDDPKGYAFGPFVLDPVRRLVWRGAEPVPLTARVFDILWYLLQHRDRLVTKDELLERIWNGTIVEEGTLIRQVSNLRKALHERPDQHEYVVTIPGRGYRFVARVEPAPLPDAESAHPAPPEPVTPLAVSGGGRPSAARGSSRRWPGPVPVAALAGTLVLVAAIGLGLGRPDTHRSALPQLTQVSFGPGLQHEPAWSPDGQAIAYSSDQLGDFDIWIQWLSETAPVRLTTSRHQDWQPDWSPDGKWIVFRSERDGGGLYVIGVNGGVERRIADFGYRPRWSPDGGAVLFSESARFSGESPRLYVVGWPGGTPAPVRPEILKDFRWVHAAWHPDGQRVSVYGRRERDRFEFVTIPLGGGPPVVSSPEAVGSRLADAGVTLGRFVWAKSGDGLYFEGRADSVRNLWRVRIDPRTLEWIGSAERLTTGPGQDGNLALSPDGAKLAFAVNTLQTRLWAFPFNPGTGKVQGDGAPITLGIDHDLGPDLPATTGDKLLYRTVRGRRGELRELSLVDGRDQPIRASSDQRFARVSPDGRRIAFVRTGGDASDRAGRRLVISSVAGGDEELLLTEVSFAPTDWSKDGNWLAGACRGPRARELAACLIPVSGAANAARVPRVVAARPQFNLYQERFSPDLKWLTFMAEPVAGSGKVGIYVVPLSGDAAWTPVVEDYAFNDKPRWAPNGKAIYYLSDRGGFMNLWGRRFDPADGRPAGEPFRVTSFDSPRRMISPDLISQVEVAIAADRLVLPLTEAAGKIWVLEGIGR